MERSLMFTAATSTGVAKQLRDNDIKDILERNPEFGIVEAHVIQDRSFPAASGGVGAVM